LPGRACRSPTAQRRTSLRGLPQVEPATATTTTAIDGGLVEFVRDLNQLRGGDVGVYASISVAQALLAADVVDELRLTIGPMIAGRGRRLLDGLPSIQLGSIRSETSPTGYLLVTIAVFVQPGDGGSCSSSFATRPSPR
jgi:dihydrofolate reductase